MYKAVTLCTSTGLIMFLLEKKKSLPKAAVFKQNTTVHHVERNQRANGWVGGRHPSLSWLPWLPRVIMLPLLSPSPPPRSSLLPAERVIVPRCSDNCCNNNSEINGFYVLSETRFWTAETPLPDPASASSGSAHTSAVTSTVRPHLHPERALWILPFHLSPANFISKQKLIMKHADNYMLPYYRTCFFYVTFLLHSSNIILKI